ncbi:MAG: phosphatase PAP2 family protein [Bacteroidetes bacterium]|nr:phosphatase PAP2 family protein [Bacteroidota bacterium]
MLETLLQFDSAISLSINHLNSDTLDHLMIQASYKWTWVPFYALLLGLLFKQNSWKLVLLMMGFIALNVVLTDQLSVMMKDSFMRLRPCHNAELSTMLHLPNGCGGQYGFVSSHSANTMGLAILLAQFLRGKWVLPTMLIFALLNGYSRIYLGKHYFLDVIGCFTLAIVIGVILLFIFDRLRLRLNLANE